MKNLSPAISFSLRFVGLAMVLVHAIPASANAERDSLNRDVENQTRRLQQLEKRALEKIARDELTRELASRSITSANQAFLEFVAAECTSKAMAAGDVGGSALDEDALACEAKMISARVQNLKARFQL